MSAPHGDDGAGADPVKCPICNRPFRDAAAVARHRERTVPCAGTSKTRPGEPCDTCLTPPRTVCRFHGGNAPQVRAAVQRRRQTAIAQRAVADFALPVKTTYEDALVDNLARWTGIVMFTAGKIAEFDSDDELTQTSIGAGRERYDRPAVWVEMHLTALREQRTSAKVCADVGIDERRTKLAEHQGQLLDGVLRAMVAGILARWIALGHTEAEVRAFEQQEIPAIVRAAVFAVVPPEQLNGGA